MIASHPTLVELKICFSAISSYGITLILHILQLVGYLKQMDSPKHRQIRIKLPMQTRFPSEDIHVNLGQKVCLLVSPFSKSILMGQTLLSLFFPPGKLCIRKSLLWESLTAGSRQQTAAGKSRQVGSPRETITRSSRKGSNIAFDPVLRESAGAFGRGRSDGGLHISRGTTEKLSARSEFREAHFGTPAGNPVLRDLHFHGRRQKEQARARSERK